MWTCTHYQIACHNHTKVNVPYPNFSFVHHHGIPWQALLVQDVNILFHQFKTYSKQCWWSWGCLRTLTLKLLLALVAVHGLLMRGRILSIISAKSLMVGTPINVVWPLLFVDLWNGKGLERNVELPNITPRAFGLSASALRLRYSSYQLPPPSLHLCSLL